MTTDPGSPQSGGRIPPSRIARRGFVVGGLALIGVAGLGSARWFNVSAQVAGGDLSVKDAHRAALAGNITLVDIRRPDEWARTGVGEGAIPIDMRSDAFIQTLLQETDGQRDKPVALICARGVRSARLAARLEKAGFTQIINVPEGMLGSGAGPGWLKSDLPVIKP